MASEDGYLPDRIDADDESRLQVFSERIARRTLLKRGGKLAVALGGLGLTATAVTPSAYAVSPYCSSYSNCACNNGTCYQNGVTCQPRYGQCSSGGQCWSYTSGSDTCTSCDWYCNGNACDCVKCSRPGKPPAASQTPTATPFTNTCG